jgi:lipopolysaccharide transport system ATP-binding protein
MSAILRLTEQAIVLEKGKLVLQAQTAQAIDYYMSSGFSDVGERVWQPDEVPFDSAPFTPLALRVKDRQGRVVDTLRSTEPITIGRSSWAAQSQAYAGIYLLTLRGEYVHPFDIDQPEKFEQYSVRSVGTTSRCTIPGDF